MCTVSIVSIDSIVRIVSSIVNIIFSVMFKILKKKNHLLTFCLFVEITDLIMRYSVSDRHIRKKAIQVLRSGVESITFQLLVQMLYQ